MTGQGPCLFSQVTCPGLSTQNLTDSGSLYGAPHPHSHPLHGPSFILAEREQVFLSLKTILLKWADRRCGKTSLIKESKIPL